MAEFLIRPAQKREAADLAILDNIAGHGISQWFWSQAVENGEASDTMNFGRQRLASDEIFAWRNAYVASHDDMVAGSITSYLMPKPADDQLADLKRTAPGFVPVTELYNLAVTSWFIDALAVFEEYRGNGIAGKLLKNSLVRGKHTGAKRAMLVCDDTNKIAGDLYRNFGFSSVDERPFVDFGLNHNAKKWLLMAVDY